MMRRMALISAVAALATAGMAQAAITVDGTLDADYGAAKYVSGTLTNSSGNALLAAYSTVQNGNLYVFLAGNYAKDGSDAWSSRYNVLIDAGIGGENVLTTYVSKGGYGRLTRSTADGGGLKLDAGFTASYYFTMAGGGADCYIDAVNIKTGANPVAGDGGVGHLGDVGYGHMGSGSVWGGTQWALNNDNTVGLTTLGTKADYAAVTTGYEFAIPLTTLGAGVTASDIKIAAFICGKGGDTNQNLTNQIIGAPDGLAVAGDPWWQVKFNDSYPVNDGGLPGNQYISVPEPTSIGFVAMGLMAIAGKRRRVR